jgi:hypothetical protein
MEAAGLIALVAPLRRHSDTLRARVLHAAREEPVATGAAPRRSGLGRWVERLAGPAAAAAVAGVLVWATMLQVQVQRLQSRSDEISTRVADTQRQVVPDIEAVKAQAQQVMSLSEATYEKVDDYQTALNVVAGTSASHRKMVSAPFAPDVSADAYWDRDRQMFVFLFENLPPAPSGQAYQVWLWKNGVARGGDGTFLPSPRGSALEIVPAAGSGWSDWDGISVTLEASAGSSEPTGRTVVELAIN